MKVELNKSDILQVRAMLKDIRGGADLALARAINRGVSHGQTQAVKAIGQELNLKAKRIKSDFSMRKAKKTDLSGAVIATGQPVGLLNFGASVRKTGVSVKVKRKGARQLLKHAFKAKTSKPRKDGSAYTTEHLFWRKYDGPRQKVVRKIPWAALPEKYRMPLERLSGPRIEDIFDDPNVYDPVYNLAADKTAETLFVEAEKILARHS